MNKLQQGDVLLNCIDEIDLSNGEVLDNLVLAEGETTGHMHRITSGQAKLIMLKQVMYLQVLSAYAKLWHDEHKEIDVPQGLYVVKKVIEYDHFLEENRQVMD